MSKYSSNVTNTLSPQGIQKVVSDAAKAWEEVQKLNEQIKSTEDESMNYSVACGRVVHN